MFDKKASAMETQLGDMQSTSASARDVSDQLSTLQARHSALVAQHAAAVAAGDESAATAAALQAELDGVRAIAASAQRDAAMHENASIELRDMVLSLQTRVGEYQAKDLEVYARIREAMEVAEKVLSPCPALCRSAYLACEASFLSFGLCPCTASDTLA
jgi:hypothetical protein